MILESHLVPRVPREGVNKLLDILCKESNKLPVDSRTLLKMPKICNIENIVFIREIWNMKCLAQNKIFAKRSDNIALNINVDCVPIFKSSDLQMWHIVASFFVQIMSHLQ